MSVALRRRRGRRARERAEPAPPAASLAADGPSTALGSTVAGAEAETPVPYVGLVTRTIAFALDAALINVVALVVGAVVTLALSVLTLPQSVKAVLAAVGGAVYLLWVVAYFVTFWTTTGQTPGDRLLRFRVQPASGGSMRPRRAALRFIALTLAALPLFAGFLLILVDDRRRGLHDRIARTVVVEAPREDEEPRARRSGDGVGARRA